MLTNNLKGPSGYFSMAALGVFCPLPAALQNNLALGGILVFKHPMDEFSAVDCDSG